jgi:hypothetical protein
MPAPPRFDPERAEALRSAQAVNERDRRRTSRRIKWIVFAVCFVGFFAPLLADRPAPGSGAQLAIRYGRWVCGFVMTVILAWTLPNFREFWRRDVTGRR